MLLSVCICLVEYVPAAHRESGPELRSVPRPRRGSRQTSPSWFSSHFCPAAWVPLADLGSRGAKGPPGSVLTLLGVHSPPESPAGVGAVVGATWVCFWDPHSAARSLSCVVRLPQWSPLCHLGPRQKGGPDGTSSWEEPMALSLVGLGHRGPGHPPEWREQAWGQCRAPGFARTRLS